MKMYNNSSFFLRSNSRKTHFLRWSKIQTVGTSNISKSDHLNAVRSTTIINTARANALAKDTPFNVMKSINSPRLRSAQTQTTLPISIHHRLWWTIPYSILHTHHRHILLCLTIIQTIHRRNNNTNTTPPSQPPPQQQYYHTELNDDIIDGVGGMIKREWAVRRRSCHCWRSCWQWWLCWQWWRWWRWTTVLFKFRNFGLDVPLGITF